jgi:hypothetical protein
MPNKKRMSFELDEEMMAVIAAEFSPGGIADSFQQAIAGKQQDEIEEIGRKVFLEYGKNLMRRSLQLGEEFPDRTYELLREAADRTGSLTFPLVPQRFIEIAFLAVQNKVELPVIENHARQLIFRLEKCRIYEQIAEKSGNQAAAGMYCTSGCLEACRTAFNGFGIDLDDLTFEMNATTGKEGYCEFVVRKGSGKFDF